LSRHPEVRGAIAGANLASMRHASKGDGPGAAADSSFEARRSASKTLVNALMARTSADDEQWLTSNASPSIYASPVPSGLLALECLSFRRRAQRGAQDPYPLAV